MPRRPRAITIAILAMGGEGGGVLADWIVDIGPGAGEHGGQVVVSGSVEDLLAAEHSLTGQYLAGKIRAPAARNHSADAITERTSRDKRGGRARARSEQSNGQTAHIWLLGDPAHHVDQAAAEQLNVEDFPPVIFFVGHKKVEQKSCDTSPIERFGNLNVAFAETTRTATMRENNQGPSSSRTRQSTCQIERRNLHISR